jgi:hypothetical protein
MHHSLQHVGRNCCHFFPDVLFQIHYCPWFLFVHLALEISSQKEVLQLGTLVPMNIEVPTKYPRSQNRIVVLKYVSTTKARCSTDQPSMATKMLWVSLEERSRTNSPRQRFHSQLFYKNRQVFLPDLVYVERDVWLMKHNLTISKKWLRPKKPAFLFKLLWMPHIIFLFRLP